MEELLKEWKERLAKWKKEKQDEWNESLYYDLCGSITTLENCIKELEAKIKGGN